MPLLHIYDSSDSSIRQTAGARGADMPVPIASANLFINELVRLANAGTRYDRILFETHGCPGNIWFGSAPVNAGWWRAVKPQNLSRITAANARIYFNGCNVAENQVGWEFLEAAADTLLSRGGEVFGQTSLGFPNPFNGHVVHLWGSTRRLYVGADNRIIERFEQ